MRRACAMLAAAGAAAVLAQTAHAEIELRGVDAHGFPVVRATVVTSRPTGAAPRVWENDRRAIGVATENLGRSKAVVLAIDRSRSMQGDALDDAITGAVGFVRARSAPDRIAVVAFGVNATQLTPFSRSAPDATRALQALRTGRSEGTALHDALALSATLLQTETRAGRVVVLLTDGQRDTASSESLATAIEAARDTGVVVYPIAIRRETFALRQLRRIAVATGGRLYVAGTSAELPAIYARIAAELARTWRLEFTSAARPGEAARIAVTVPGEGTAATRVTLPGRRDASVTGAAGFAASAWGDLALALVVGGLVMVAVHALASYRRARWLRSRLDPAGGGEQRAERRSLRTRAAGLGSGVVGATEKAFAGSGRWSAIERRLERADVPLRPAELVYAMLGAAIVLALLGALVGASGLLLFLLAMTGMAGPYLFVTMRGRRRLRAFEEQLPDLLMTLASSLKAGHSFRQGLQTIVDEGQDPARKEFQRVLSEARLGRPVEEALDDMAERLGSANFSFVVAAVAVQRQVGGSLAGIFDMVAEAVRDRQQFARRVKAITAQGRMSAYTLVALPFLLALMLSVINPEYMQPLYATSLGKTLILVALVLMGFGGVILRRIVSVR